MANDAFRIIRQNPLDFSSGVAAMGEKELKRMVTSFFDALAPQHYRRG
jgi:hypothetical protein